MFEKADLAGRTTVAPSRGFSALGPHVWTTVLTACGAAAFCVYMAMDFVASLADDRYSYRDQTISELSAVGAPTRAGWIVASVFYQVLMVGFACGVLRAARGHRLIRIVGWLLVALAALGPLWWVAPMHQRDVLAADGGTWQDRMHLTLAGASSVLFFGIIGLGSFVFGLRFRMYSFATIGVMLVFGSLMNMNVAKVGENEPTPWLGIWERLVVEGAMLWQAVFAIVLIRKRLRTPQA